ncbi:MAG: thiamine diphosphokinase [Clostridiales bacterium]|jgi:thiamine pyrophosphokinase|nr:thiamine diphosphokinase [Clostridiales bacterium]
MEKGICRIVGAGEYSDLNFTAQPGDYIIAADGGLLYLEQNNIKANLVIGDFDSLKPGDAHNNSFGGKIITLNKHKDDTDTFAAVKEGIRLGYKRFYFYCCTGGRIDHTLANIQTLAFLSKNNMSGYLFDKTNAITAITNGSISFGKKSAGFVSVFSFSEKCSGVTLTGLKYKLDNADVVNTFPIGVSNEFAAPESEISVKSGTLLVVFPKDAVEFINLRGFQNG